MLERRLQIALSILEPDKWQKANQLTGKSAVYSSPHSLGNVLGRLRSMGFVEFREISGHKQWKLTEAGEEARTQCLTTL